MVDDVGVLPGIALQQGVNPILDPVVGQVGPLPRPPPRPTIRSAPTMTPSTNAHTPLPWSSRSSDTTGLLSGAHGHGRVGPLFFDLFEDLRHHGVGRDVFRLRLEVEQDA